jgi:methyl-accepting chemotaxis protein
MTIRSKITLLATLAVAGALLLTAIVTSFVIYNSAKDAMLHSARDGVEQADANAAALLSQSYSLLHSIASNPTTWTGHETWSSYLDTTVKTMPPDLSVATLAEATARNEIEVVRLAFPELKHVLLGDDAGRFVMSPAEPRPAGYDPRVRPWWVPTGTLAERKGFWVTDNGHKAISLSEPAVLPDGGRGVASLTLGVEGLEVLTRNLNPGAAGFTYLMETSSGVILSGPDVSLLGKTPLAGNETALKQAPELAYLSGLDLVKSGLFLVTDPSNKPWDVLVHPANTSGWTFLVFIDPQEYWPLAQDALLINAAVATVALIIILIVALFLARRISKPLLLITNSVKELAEGEADLTTTLPLASNDEIGDLTKHFNTFIKKQRDLIADLKTRATHLTQSSQELSAALVENSASIHEITQSARLASERLVQERQMVSQSNERVIRLAKGLESIQHGVDATLAATAQASSAIEEMASNITATAQMGQRGGETADDLRQHANTSFEAMNDLAISTGAVAAASAKIVDAVSIIKKLAAQTNLLSMNAAIEAAHAGDAGAGFAVVASEIRLLADQSTAGAKEITAAVKDIQKTIQANEAQTTKALTGFKQVQERVIVVSNMSKQIADAMLEQSQANKELLTAVDEMRKQGDAIGVLAHSEAEGSVEIRDFLAKLEQLSQEISASKDEEAQGMEDINQAMASLTAVMMSLKQIGDEMQDEFGKFKTEH